MKTILSCESLRLHLKEAQRKMKTDYPVVEIDSALHAVPKKMRKSVFSAMENLPEEVDMVLIAMGHCGGALADYPFPRRAVIPKVDDCITLLLHTDDTWYPNLKETGCMYLTDQIDGNFSIRRIRESLIERYGEKRGIGIFREWFKAYHSVKIIDTGVYDAYAPDYLKKARADAHTFNGELTHVPGSNLILEKLVSGNWGHQFICVEKGQVLTTEDFV